MTTEEMMNELTEKLAADPRGQVDARAWRALLTYAPMDLLKRPVSKGIGMKTLNWWQWILVAALGLPLGLFAVAGVGWFIESLPLCVGCK